MYCQKCGKQIADGSVFCQHCGAQIGNVVSDNFSNQNANQNYENAKPFASFFKLFAKRSFKVLLAAHQPSDLPNLRVHASFCNNRFCVASRDDSP